MSFSMRAVDVYYYVLYTVRVVAWHGDIKPLSDLK